MGNEKRMEKDWLLWGPNLLTRRTTKMLIQDALLTRFEDEKTRQVLFVCVCLLWNLQAFSQTFFRICNNVDGWVGFVFAGSSEEGVFCKESGRDASTPDTTEGSDL